MPYASWQFWVVTLFLLVAIATIIRPFFPGSKKNSCCSNAAKQKKTKLTVSAKAKH
jgi:hypothetical protein